MKTQLLKACPESLEKGAEIIRAGGLVAFPTETVYGLGADAMNGEAVNSIFRVKGRPNDNPLIVHVCSKEQMKELVNIDSGSGNVAGINRVADKLAGWYQELGSSCRRR